MPIYEFLCKSCGNVFEHLVFGTGEGTSCQKCGSPDLTKLLSASSSLSGANRDGRLPGAGDTRCCGSAPSSRGCVPGSCCGKA